MYPLFNPSDVCLNNPIGTFNVDLGEFSFPGGTFDVFNFTEFAFFQACNPTIDLKNFRIWYFASENCFNMEDDDGDNSVDCADTPVCDCSQRSPSYPNQQFKWNAPYQNQSEVDFDYFYDVLNENGLQISPSMMGSLPQLAQGEPFLTRLPIQWTGIPYNPTPDEPRFEPSSYIERADWMYQYVTRYGNNANNPICELKYHSQETDERGRGNIQYIESWNEPDRTWEGNAAEFTASEYAAMASCDYDGHGGTLSGDAPNCNGSYTLGVINADPNISFVMGAPFELKTGWLDEMNTWFENNRPDGAFIFDVINFHHYSLPENNINGDWMSPEEDLLKSKLVDIRDYAVNDLGLTDKEFWLSEFGYDTDQNSFIGPEFPVALEAAVGAEKLQAQWTVRSFLEIAAAGFDRAMVHDLRDATFPGQLSNWDQTTGLLLRDGSPKEAWFYVYSMKNILEGYTFISEHPMGNCDEHFFDENATGECPRIYKFQKGNDACDIVWAIWNPSASNITEFDLEDFELECGTSATGIKLKAGSINGELVDIFVDSEGMATIPVSEDPIFIVEKDLEKPICPNIVELASTCTSASFEVEVPLGQDYNLLQIWYGEAAAVGTNPNFSPFDGNLTLYEHDLVGTNFTVSGLMPDTEYYIYVVPQTNTGTPDLVNNECRILVKTEVDGSGLCFIPITPEMIIENSDDNITDIEGSLFDQQYMNFCDSLPFLPNDSIVPPWVDYNNTIPNFAGVIKVIDLHFHYDINQFYVYDGNGAGIFEINWRNDPNDDWQSLTTYYTNARNEWVSITDFVQPADGIRYLQFVNNNNRANLKEMFICGTETCLLGDNPTTQDHCFNYDPQLGLYFYYPSCSSIQFRAFDDSQANLYKDIQIWYTEASNGAFEDGKHPDTKAGVESLVTQLQTVTVGFGSPTSYPAVTITGLENNTAYHFAYRMLDGNGGSTPLYIMDEAVGTAYCFNERFLKMGPMVVNCEQTGIWWEFPLENIGAYYEIVKSAGQLEKTAVDVLALTGADRIDVDEQGIYTYIINRLPDQISWLYFRYVSDTGIPLNWIEWNLDVDPCPGLDDRSAIFGSYLENDYFEKGVELYPNPTDDFLFLRFEDNRYQEFQIVDLMGRNRLSGKVDLSVEEMKIDLTNLTGGVYYLQLKGEKVRWQAFKFVLSE